MTNDILCISHAEQYRVHDFKEQKEKKNKLELNL